MNYLKKVKKSTLIKIIRKSAVVLAGIGLYTKMKNRKDDGND